jgi:hypothetical protein
MQLFIQHHDMAKGVGEGGRGQGSYLSLSGRGGTTM